ncbi:hypothetical protein NB647_05555 [Oxalobacter aliiformigenes]|uniref:hypothetical protein n=1 Tax=Oxalobacter aliiformigenes TaxID=2946593 RepID=UPI0022AE88CD|nr:hypothetical protein [Oxalobacter aliiformigenes]WAV88373.1 hypothetical protein NB647_05555 [Oxalobacter aliiformigenes]
MKQTLESAGKGRNGKRFVLWGNRTSCKPVILNHPGVWRERRSCPGAKNCRKSGQPPCCPVKPGPDGLTGEVWRIAESRETEEIPLMILTGIRIPGKLRKAGRRDLKGGPMLMEKAFAFPAKTIQTGVSERGKRFVVRRKRRVFRGKNRGKRRPPEKKRRCDTKNLTADVFGAVETGFLRDG